MSSKEQSQTYININDYRDLLGSRPSITFRCVTTVAYNPEQDCFVCTARCVDTGLNLSETAPTPIQARKRLEQLIRNNLSSALDSGVFSFLGQRSLTLRQRLALRKQQFLHYFGLLTAFDLYTVVVPVRVSLAGAQGTTEGEANLRPTGAIPSPDQPAPSRGIAGLVSRSNLLR